MLAALRRLPNAPAAGNVVSIKRSPSPYASTFPLEEIRTTNADGSEWLLLFKDVSESALSAAAKDAKPSFLFDPAREITVYRDLLSTSVLGTAAYYGSVVVEPAGRHWLFLENVQGSELYTVGELETWMNVARWLARFHGHFVGLDLDTRATRLISYDAAYYQRWLRRAIEFSKTHEDRRSALSAIASHHSKLIDELLALPSTLVHGDFYASNIIVGSRAVDSERICAVDWEQAARGPGLVDLAALTAGNWTEEQKREFARVYFAAQSAALDQPLDWNAFLRAFDLCRLHLAIQWLGWSDKWTPPPEHHHDWLIEAQSVAERIL